MSKGAALECLHADDIRAYILDPEKYPLPEGKGKQFDRVMTAARLLDSNPNQTVVRRMLMAKYKDLSRTMINKDIALAMELYKSNHTFDWDFWQAWQINDQLELIKRAKANGNLKIWNEAKKTLLMMIGEKPEAITDPKRMEKNVFVLQFNHLGQTFNIDLAKFRSMPREVQDEFMKQMNLPITEEEATTIMNS